NYYSQEANRAYFSVSQLKSFMDCEARTMAELEGSYERSSSQALLVGGYIDAHFSHGLDLFRAQHPEIYTRTGSLRAEYAQAEAIIARIERDPLAMRMLSGDTQRIVTGEIEGQPFKAKLDVLLSGEQCEQIAEEYPQMGELLFAPGAIVDLKIMRDFKPLYREDEGRLNFIEYWRYDLQLAIYQQLVKKELPCYILAATKEPVPDIELFRLPQALLDTAYELGTDKLAHFALVKAGAIEPERCGQCDYCRQTKLLTCGTYPGDWA
ncbi:MAG: PD-(D/E)XK nuclease-like domain-containing protein, partial [Eubacteriales bacterium]|nr:PD-(D/E)XK nuclease-like domain-containing protein [Eubacteriales bacterium]